MDSEKIPLLCVVGPTASGKTWLAVELAKAFDGEVVSADSMQVYKTLSIGTAKPSPEEMQGVPHHLLDFLPIEETFSVAQFLELARGCIREIAGRGKLPILAGGTGLYISSLIDHVNLSPIESDPALRAALEEAYDRDGGAALMAELAQADPESSAKIHPNNRGRVVRAVEVCRLTGVPISAHQRRSREQPSPYRLCMIGLRAEDRAFLYDRINRRVDAMMAQGLLEEARALWQAPLSQTAAQAIGYKELFAFFRGECTLEQAVEQLKQDTRRYAKRQLTWFGREERIHWLAIDQLEKWKLLEISKKIVAQSGNL